jgi:hypothetical protein
MMPREKYFLGEIAIGYWYKRAVPVVVSLVKMCFLEEVKGQKGCRRFEGLASSRQLLVRTLNPPREAATQGENTGRIPRAAHISRTQELHYLFYITHTNYC